MPIRSNMRRRSSVFEVQTLQESSANIPGLNLELQNLLDRKSAIPLEPAIEGYLNHSAQRIGNSSDYEILFYGRWSQTKSDRNH